MTSLISPEEKYLDSIKVALDLVIAKNRGENLDEIIRRAFCGFLLLAIENMQLYRALACVLSMAIRLPLS